MSYQNNQVAFSGQRPMCGIGTEIEKGESREATINRAGLDFTIEQQPLTYLHGDNTIIDETVQVMTRSDNGFRIGLNSKRFKVVQPHDILAPFFDVVENLGFEPSLVGQFDGGRKLFLQAKAPDDLSINGDRIQGILTLATANDGSAATTGDFMTNRIICMNQCQMIMRKGNKLHSTRHTSQFDANKLINDLGLNTFQESFISFEETMRELIDTRVSNVKALELVHKLIGKTGNPDDESTKTSNVMETIFNNVMNSAGAQHSNCKIDKHNITGYGFLQGVTHYTSHQAGRNDNNRAKGLLSNGSGTKLVNNAMELLDMLPVEPTLDMSPRNDAQALLGMV